MDTNYINTQPYPSGSITSEVDVRILSGNFIPCNSCHWRPTCVVPKNGSLGKLREYFALNDITYHNVLGRNHGQVYYHCLDYTIFPKGQR